MQLVEEGLVDLDATVDTYLPDVLAGESITVRHVLSHQSGLFNITDYPALVIGLFSDPFQEVTPQQVIDIALEQDRLFVPGEQFSYSNTNYLIAGSIVEEVTGNSLAGELETRVYAPLGLEDMRLAGELGRPVVNGFTDFDADREPDPTEPLLGSTLYTVAWAAGGLAATAGEFATFVSGAFKGPLLGADTVTTMTTAAGPEGGYGLGAVVEPLDGETVWGHGGAIPGYTSQFYYFPVDGLVVVALSNGENASIETFAQTAAGIVRDGQ
jgi:D-alanyl-D-alanine carboxypeptidase